MTTITRENAEIKSFITGFLSDTTHDKQSSNSLLANVFRIALASLEAVSDERAAYELFMEKRFGESVDRRRAKNGDSEYMAWDMALGWIIWCHRAAMPQAGNFREISETSTCSPVIPAGWISCSERMPDDGQHVIILCDGAFVLYAQCRDGEFFDVVRNGEEFFETQSRNVTHWMLLPEPPQEVN